MIKLILTATIALLTQSSIYSFTVTGIDGEPIDFSAFQGKKILVVNIATSSPRASQLAALQQLQQQYSDSLVVIGFPSNSFGNESRTNSQIRQYCQSQYGASFLMAAKGSVKGEDMQSIYHWLTHKTENGVFNNDIQEDFQKYLFDSNGNPLGIFTGFVSPLSPLVTNAITGSQN